MNCNNRRSVRALLAIGVLTSGIASLVGSGGGGGGSSFSGGGTNLPLLAITSNNAFDVASAVVQAVLLGFDTADVGSGPIAPEPPMAPATLSGTADGPVAYALEVTGSRAGMLALEVAVGPVTEACDGGGTTTISGDLANPGTITAGDTLTVQFDNCDDNDGTVINGRLDLTVLTIAGDPLSDVFRLSANTMFTNLTVVDGGVSAQAQGDVTVTLDSLNFPVTVDTLEGSFFEIASQGEVFTLTNFTQSLTVDGGVIPDTKSAEAMGRLGSQLLGGSVDYETTAPIGATGDADPDSGEILVTGADNSMMQIVIVDSTSVRLVIDADGDGMVDDQQFTTWAALTGQTSAVNTSTAPVIAREVIASFLDFPGTDVGGQFSAGNPYANLALLAVSGNFGPVQVACPISGDASISGFIATPGTYGPGDQLNTSFNACERQAATLTGQMDVTVNTFQGAPGSAYRFDGSATFTNVVRDSGAGPVTANGTLTNIFDQSFTTPGNLQSDSAANSFTLEANAVTRNLSAVTSPLQVDFTVQPPVPSTIFPAGTLTTSALSGTFVYAINAPFQSLLDGDPTTFASSGDMLVTASDTSSVRIVALDALNARLDIDLDGDSIVDDELFFLWADLLP
ncbi:MAG: hypothetical protein JSV45_02980 [Chromatiales bacterium]|nr:MAG: hypothetical protein JSV45_02980 [Chromatiales bacterium]